MRSRSYLLLVSAFILLIFVYNSIFSSTPILIPFTCTIPLEGKDPMVYGYLCAVDRCIHEFFETSKTDKFEDTWRKFPHNLNWCSTNAQMSVRRFTTNREILLFKVKNMLEKKKRPVDHKCTAVAISFDADSSLRDLEFEKILPNCQSHHVVFSSKKANQLANILKNIGQNIDLLIVGPSKTSSFLLFQQFLGEYVDYLPNVCQINFAHTLPKTSEEAGFNESILKLRNEKKFLLMGSSKDRTDMYLNLFFVNMNTQYCRERYFRYFSYY